MTIAAIVIGWYAAGCVGSALVLYFGFHRGGHDIEAVDLVFGAFMAILGVCGLLAGILISVISEAQRKPYLKTNRVIWKGKR